MLNRYKNNIKHNLLPCFTLSMICGAFTGAFVFLFKILATLVIRLSSFCYAYVRENPIYIPLLFVALLAVGFASYFVIKYAPIAKGGGIPSAVTFIRGFVTFKWFTSALAVFGSTLITFLGGIPLGNEGPSVQMGCAIGRGTVNIFANKNRAWDKYIMTGGATAGFSAATGAPISAIMFSMEEIHHRFTPILFISVSVATVSSSLTIWLLSNLTGINSALFDFNIDYILPVKYIWAAIVIGIIVGIVSVAFTKLYSLVDRIINKALKTVPLIVKVISIFVVTGAFGIINENFLGSGHDIVENIFNSENFSWYILLILLAVRAIMLLFSNCTGITGGIFVPSIAFGAILGELSAKLLISLEILPEEYKSLMVVIGIASFLGAASRIPLTAILFSVEALSGFNNIIPIALGVTFSYIVIEAAGVTAFADIIIERKIENSFVDKERFICNVKMKVKKYAFVDGKEIRDILWPHTCVVESVYKQNPHSSFLQVGDILTIKYKTVNVEETYRELVSLIGEQNQEVMVEFKKETDDRYHLPEN